ncbi:MAG: hypothetical protein IPM60_06015 [Rhodospirillales bacterium]|nr:hypothetical protein [Rhodospirillales bacterium]
MAIRLGLRQVKGLAQRDGEALVAARGGGYRSVADVWRRSRLGPAALTMLAHADGFGSLGLDRRQALWAVRGLETAPLDLFEAAATDIDSAIPLSREPAVRLPEAALGEQVAEDYRSLRLSLKAHPLALLRDELRASGHVSSEDLGRARQGKRVKVAGVVTTRQRPGTASGVIFITLEDEFGHINLIVWPTVLERFRKAVLGATMMEVAGRLQREGEVLHVIAEQVWDASATLGALAADAGPGRASDEARFHVHSRDFH